jgi:16S rRNA G1207 methylase RsmC
MARRNDSFNGTTAYEAVVIPGLERFATDELRAALPGASVRETSREGRLAVSYRGDPSRFGALNSVVAVHALLRIEAQRPSALLGHENFSAISRLAGDIIGAYPAGAFETLRLSAAGANSTVLRRFTNELAAYLGLEVTTAAANLELALRRAEQSSGWELLLRLSPMPLSARAWRVCDYPGALNATVAHFMVSMTQPDALDVFVNACCGSGTLLAERLHIGPVSAALGFDNSTAAIDCARQNLRGEVVQLALSDTGALPLVDGAASSVVADPPFAMLLGAGDTNRALYPSLFGEAARVLRPGGSFAVISTQERLVREVIEEQMDRWLIAETVRVKLPHERGYITPTIRVLRRR